MGVKRINITLPEDVLEILNKKAKNGEKSSYIAEAVRAYSKKQSQQLLVREMIRGYEATALEDRQDQELWSKATSDDGLDD